MKLLYEGEYNDQERVTYREIIFNNTVQCMSVVVQSLPQLDLALTPENEQHAAPIVLNADPAWMDQESLPHVLTTALVALWNDPGVQAAVKRSKEFQLNDSAT